MITRNVYVVYNPLSKLTKIGMSGRLNHRINFLSMENGVRLELRYNTLPCINSDMIENSMHKYFKDHRTLGEWFDIDPDDAVNKLKEYTVQLPEIVQDYLNGLSIKELSIKYSKSRQYIEKLFKESCVESNNKTTTILPPKTKINRRDNIKKVEQVSNEGSISKERLEEMIRKSKEKYKLK
jgi:site-specific recombinase XerC